MEEKKSNAFAITSLVLGIVSIVFSLIGIFFIGLISGSVGIVFGVLARKSNPSGMATGGLVTSIIGTSLSAIVFIACTACMAMV